MFKIFVVMDVQNVYMFFSTSSQFTVAIDPVWVCMWICVHITKFFCVRLKLLVFWIPSIV